MTNEERAAMLVEMMEHPGWMSVLMSECGKELRALRSELWGVGPSDTLDQKVCLAIGGVASIRNVIARLYHNAGREIPDDVKAFID